MSFVLSFKAGKLAVGSAAEKAVLRCLCDYANDDGSNCRPATSTISAETELNKKTVFKAVASLAGAGWIEVSSLNGRQNFYQINAARIEAAFLETKADKQQTNTKIGTGVNFGTGTKNGSGTDTKNGTKTSTKFGTSTKNGPIPVPKTVHNSVNTQSIINTSKDVFVHRAENGSTKNGLNITTQFSTEPRSAVNQVQNCTRFRTEPPPSSELNHLPSSAVNHEPINEPINTSFVRRAETGSPNASANESAEDKEFNLTEPTEEKELTPEQRAKQVAKRCPQEKLIELYHQCLPTLPPVRIWMSARRQQALSARWREMAIDQGFQSEAEGLDFFKRFFEFVGKSPFLMGQVKQKEGRSWRADLEWIVQQKNFEKICDRRYHDH